MVKDYGVRIQHAGIHVKSLAETEKWYHDIFGFEYMPQAEGSGAFGGGVFPKMRWMNLGDGAFKLEIYEVQDAEPFSLVDFEFSHGVKHLNFAVKDIDGWFDYIKEYGVEIVVDNRYGGRSRAIYILDNNGILVEVTNDEFA